MQREAYTHCTQNQRHTQRKGTTQRNGTRHTPRKIKAMAQRMIPPPNDQKQKRASTNSTPFNIFHYSRLTFQIRLLFACISIVGYLLGAVLLLWYSLFVTIYLHILG